VYFGPGSPLNSALHVPGKQTNNWAELFAFFSSLRLAPPEKSLLICPDSEYAICSIIEWAPSHAACGWCCENGDVLQHIAAWIHFHQAPLEFWLVWAHNGNKHGDAADALAKSGARKPLLATSQLCLPDAVHQLTLGLIVLPRDKVFSSLCLLTAKVGEGTRDVQLLVKSDSYAVSTHCGWRFFHMAKAAALQELVEASSNFALFWKHFRSLADPKHKAPLVSLDALTSIFQRRMNPPPTMPASFNSFCFLTNTLQLAHLPSVTVDMSPDGVFSREWQVDEIEWPKAHVKEHTLSSARGIDGVDYSTILEIENEELCSLFNDCMAHCDAPSV
jgi:ribonuclease HI